MKLKVHIPLQGTPIKNVTAQSQCLRTWLMSLAYKSLSVSCFNGQLQLWVSEHGSLGRDPLCSRLLQMLRVTGEVVEGASHWVGGESGIETGIRFQTAAVWKSCHLWHDRMDICGLRHFAVVWKEIWLSLKGEPQGNPVFFFSKTHGWHFEIEKSFCMNTRKLAITDDDEHVASNVKTKQVEVWDIVFLSVKGANLKNKPAVCGKCLPIFTQRFHSLPPRQFLTQTFRLMCLPSAHLTAVKLPFSISSEKSEFLAVFHLRQN